MRAHHTKDKGDLAVAKAHADLAEKGFSILFPVSEHAPFNLVAYRDGGFRRIQVKYRAARNGALLVHFRSVWADRQGTHMKAMDKGEVDLLCIYCPDTGACYYLRPDAHRQSVTLRISPPRNHQTLGVLPAEDFRHVPD